MQWLDGKETSGLQRMIMPTMLWPSTSATDAPVIIAPAQETTPVRYDYRLSARWSQLDQYPLLQVPSDNENKLYQEPFAAFRRQNDDPEVLSAFKKTPPHQPISFSFLPEKLHTSIRIGTRKLPKTSTNRDVNQRD